MDRMKSFFKYFLLLVAFFIFSNVMINVFLNVSFRDVKDYNINVSDVFVDITEAKVSKRNGHIKGIVKNNTENVVENKYLKFSMLSEYDKVLGEKYVKIEVLNPNELRNFEVDFDYNNVKTFKVEMVDTKPEQESFIELLTNNAKELVTTTLDKIE